MSLTLKKKQFLQQQIQYLKILIVTKQDHATT
jgi:hypothetical protein